MQKEKMLSIADKVMRLRFFATRFGFCAKNAAFAILASTNEDGEKQLTPVVAINEDLYVDILKDEIHPMYNVGCCNTRCFEATVVKEKKCYSFKNHLGVCTIKVEDIYNAYKKKFLNNEMFLEAMCLK